MSRWLISLGILVTAAPAFAAPAAPLKGQYVVNQKQPSAVVARQIAAKLPARLVQMHPQGAFFIILPNRGVTAAKLAAADPRIAAVEPLLEYGATFRVGAANTAQ